MGFKRGLINWIRMVFGLIGIVKWFFYSGYWVQGIVVVLVVGCVVILIFGNDIDL